MLSISYCFNHDEVGTKTTEFDFTNPDLMSYEVHRKGLPVGSINPHRRILLEYKDPSDIKVSLGLTIKEHKYEVTLFNNIDLTDATDLYLTTGLYNYLGGASGNYHFFGILEGIVNNGEENIRTYIYSAAELLLPI